MAGNSLTAVVGHWRLLQAGHWRLQQAGQLHELGAVGRVQRNLNINEDTLYIFIIGNTEGRKKLGHDKICRTGTG